MAVVVAQLVERSIPIPEVRSSNPVIGKNLFKYWTFVYCQLCIEKTKIKKKEAGFGPFLKKISDYFLFQVANGSQPERVPLPDAPALAVPGSCGAIRRRSQEGDGSEHVSQSQLEAFGQRFAAANQDKGRGEEVAMALV